MTRLFSALILVAALAPSPRHDAAARSANHPSAPAPSFPPLPAAPAQPEAPPSAAASTDDDSAIDPNDEPEASLAVMALVTAEYLTVEERKDLRVFHGVYLPGDLDTPARRARAALIRGDLLDPSLADPRADPLDRAEAALLRGEPDAALALLPPFTPLTNPADPAAAIPPRAARIRAEALASGIPGAVNPDPPPLPDRAQAIAIIDAASLLPAGPRPATFAEDEVERVRMLALRSRLAGHESPEQADAAYRAMMARLGEARAASRLSWTAALAEARILADKDNYAEAQRALIETLSLNPRCAEAWALLARLAVDSFSIDRAESLARVLDVLATRGSSAAPGVPPPVSPHAAAARARCALRLREASLAEEALDPVLERLPRARELLALRAAAAAIRFDDDQTRQRLDAFAAQYPAAADALLEAGHALAEARQYEQAEAVLRAASALEPSWPLPLLELGSMLLQAARDEQAFAALFAAAELDPFNARAANTLALLRDLRSYARLESEHFVVRFKPGPDELLAREMLPVLEDSFRIVTAPPPPLPTPPLTSLAPSPEDERTLAARRIPDPATSGVLGSMGHLPPPTWGAGGVGAGGKTVIDLMPDHRSFGVRITGVPDIHTIAVSTGPAVAMESPRRGPGHSGFYDWPRVLRHEFTHSVQLSRTLGRMPHWFTEAAAVELELAPRPFSTCVLLANALLTDTLLDFRQINIAFVRPATPSQRSLAYAQAHWMYEFMLTRWGPTATLALMDLYAQGVTEQDAFPRALSLTRERFLDEFRPWAAQQVRAWGLLPPRGVPTLLELTLEEQQRATANADSAPPPANHADGPPDAAPVSPLTPDDIAQRPDLLDAWLALYPDHPELLGLRVRIRLSESPQRRATPEMVPLLEHLARVRPADDVPHRLLADLYLASSDPDQRARAIPHLEFLDIREESSPVYAEQLSRLRTAAADFAGALDAATRATRIAPFDPALRELAAAAALRAARPELAETHLVALAIIEPAQDVHRKRLDAFRAKHPPPQPPAAVR